MSADTNLAGVAARYATALFDLAEEGRTLDAVANDLKGLGAALAASADLRRLTRSPMFTREEQARAMQAILAKGGAQQLTQRFVGIVAQHRRLFLLPGIIRAYLKMLADLRGQVEVSVTSAKALSDPQMVKLKSALSKALGRDVDISRTVDPDLIGGLIVKIGSRMIDFSLRTKLQNLHIAMKEVG